MIRKSEVIDQEIGNTIRFEQFFTRFFFPEESERLQNRYRSLTNILYTWCITFRVMTSTTTISHLRSPNELIWHNVTIRHFSYDSHPFTGDKFTEVEFFYQSSPNPISTLLEGWVDSIWLVSGISIANNVKNDYSYILEVP